MLDGIVGIGALARAQLTTNPIQVPEKCKVYTEDIAKRSLDKASRFVKKFIEKVSDVTTLAEPRMTLVCNREFLPVPESLPNHNYFTIAALAAGMTAQLLTTAWTSATTQVEPNLYTFPKTLAPVVDIEDIPSNVTDLVLYDTDMHGVDWKQDTQIDDSEVIYSPDPRQTVWSPALNGRNILTTIASRPLKSLGKITPTNLKKDKIACHIRNEFDEALNYDEMEFNTWNYALKRKAAGHNDFHVLEDFLLWNEQLKTNPALDHYLGTLNPVKRITMKMKLDEKFFKPDFKPRPY